jgi:vancomycin resistance protein VanJ
VSDADTREPAAASAAAAPPPAPPREKKAKKKPTLFGRLVALLVYGYAAGVFVIFAMLLFLVDRHWTGTLVGYGPRWIWAGPLPFVGVAILLARRWHLVAWYGATTLLLLLGVLDWSPGLHRSDEGKPVRIVTQNLGAIMTLDDPKFATWLKDTRADVVVITECWRNEQPKASPDPDYHFAMDYTMCLLSKYPIVKVTGRPREDVWEKSGSGEIGVFEVQGPTGSFYILSLQLETVRDGLEAILSKKMGGIPELYAKNEVRRWESQLAREWAAQHAKSPFLAVGDFNMPVESTIWREYWSEYRDAWSRCGRGLGWTKLTRKTGARIDHVLFDQAWGCAGAEIMPDIGSDHLGLAVDLRLQ